MASGWFKADRSITQFLPKLAQTLPAHFNALQSHVLTFLFNVREQFARAAKTGKSRIFHAGTAWKRSFFHNHHMMLRPSPFMEEGSEQTNDARTYHNHLRTPMERAGFPDTQHVVVEGSIAGGFIFRQRSRIFRRSMRHLQASLPFRLLPLLLALLIPAFLAAQLDNVMVYGTVKDMSTAKKLDGVTVSVFKNGAKLVDVTTNASGKYEVNLDYGADFKIMCSKPGFVGKNITIDTRNVPDEERQGGHGMNIDFTMMAEIQGVDFSILQEPFGKAQYVKETGNFEWDMEYTARMRDAQARLLKEYEDKKKREANAEGEYAKAIQQGDAAMSASDFKKAVDQYGTALAIKANDPVATAKLSDARMRLEGADALKKREAEYAQLIKEADALFNKKDLEGAKTKYTAALDIKDEAHPKQRLKEIETQLAELAKKAEEERLAKELQEKYESAISAGDAALKADDLDQAEAKYTEASGLKPQEKYPKDQLAAVATRRAELAKKAEEEKKNKELQEKYQAAVAAADQAFNSQLWDNATAKYNEASTLKPEEQYPKDQLALIAVKKDEAAKKAEEERLAKELNEKYQAVVAAADAAFNKLELDEAEAKYNEALNLKAEEKYPKDQIAAIGKKRQELADKEEQERLAKELDEQYNAAIASADAAFNSQQWDEAIAKYNEATGLKPQEKYPQDQLAAIAAKQAELAKKEEEEQKARELEERYQAAIATADGAFDASEWPAATAAYKEASALKPQETYPKERLTLIDQKIAEEDQRKKQEELDAQYDAAIAAADASFDASEWTAAKTKYQEALVIKSAESYPKERIAAIDQQLAEQARLAEEEKKRQELEAKYAQLVARADQAYDAKELSAALNDYKDALQLKPEESHPKDRIADIESQLDAAAQARAEEERLLREKQEKDQRYNDLITSADKALNAQQLDQAEADYNAALEVKPEESYPQEKIAAIAKLREDMASQAEADRLAAEQAEADRLRQAELDRLAAEEAEAERLRQAELDRLAAEELARKQEEERLAAEMSAEERRRLEEEERKRREEEELLRAKYDVFIAAADRAFSGNEYDVARAKYNEALGVLPDEQYPKDRLAAIDAALAEQSASEEERRRKQLEEEEAARAAAEAERLKREGEKALEEQYANAILQADEAFAANSYEEARGLYATASDLKPEETYPISKIEQIDKLLAEQEKQRLEAELAAERAREQANQKPQNNTTIDIRKEQEAEQFMRAAREREEAEKYEKIKKFRSDLELEEQADAENASTRRMEGVAQRDRHLEEGAGLYSGDETRRRQNADDLDAMKNALAQAEADRAARAAQLRDQNLQQNMSLQEQKQQLDEQWRQKHGQQADAMAQQKDDIRSVEEQRTQRGLQNNQQAKEQADAIAANEADRRMRGQALIQERAQQLEAEKRAQEMREAQLRNVSQQTRDRNKQQLDNIPRDQPRAFADYNRSKLAMEYPPGVTEESYTEGNKVIIRRVVVNGNKADEYSKVIAKWGTFYFKNGQSITEAIWSRETEG